MALPFDKKKEGSMAIRVEPQVIRRNPDEDTDQDFDHLQVAISDLYHAVKTGDVEGGAAALRAAFVILESEPHEEFQDFEEYEGE